MIPWAQVYRRLALAYGWTFDAINKLTIYQVEIALGAAVPDEGVVQMDLDEAVAAGIFRRGAQG